MFGGYGLYQNDLMFAIVADDVLYLKSDDAIQPEFMARGLKPFTYIVEKGVSTLFLAEPSAVSLAQSRIGFRTFFRLLGVYE